MTVDDAIGTFVAWPVNLINVSQRTKSKVSGNVERSRPSNAGKSKVSGNVGGNVGKSKASGKEIESRHSQSIAGRSSSNAMDFISYLKIHALNHLDSDAMIEAFMDRGIFGEEQVLTLNQEELKAVYDHEWASATSIRAYIRYLYYEILVPTEQTQRYVFICPETTFLLNIPLDKTMPQDYIDKCREQMERNKVEVKANIDRRLALSHELNCDSLFFAPINLGTHWILLVIDPKKDLICYLDSLLGHYNNYPKLVGVFNSALATYWGLRNVRTSYRKSTSSTKWKAIRGPKQSNGDDCGYHVMKFMKDIITRQQMTIPNNYFPEYVSGAPMSDEEITEVRGEWCRHVINLIHANRN